MSDPSKLDALIDRWEQLSEQGEDVSAEELCRDCPELLEPLKRRIHARRATAWMDETTGPEDPGLLSTRSGRADADDDEPGRATGPLTVEDFVEAVIASGLMSADDLRDFQAGRRSRRAARRCPAARPPAGRAGQADGLPGRHAAGREGRPPAPRPLHHPRHPRQRRHGTGLQGAAPRDGADRRPEGAARRRPSTPRTRSGGSGARSGRRRRCRTRTSSPRSTPTSSRGRTSSSWNTSPGRNLSRVVREDGPLPVARRSITSPRRRGAWSTPTPRGSSTATSSRPTSCSPPRGRSSSSTWAWCGSSRPCARVPASR